MSARATKPDRKAPKSSKPAHHVRTTGQPSAPLSVVHPNAAGLDIGKEEILVAVPAERDPHPVRSYTTFTPDLHALVDWLQCCQIDTVAMESTGVYWIPLYELLEAGGIRCFLINAAHFKRVPGRKSDVQDCQWLQQCHSFGLLADSGALWARTRLPKPCSLKWASTCPDGPPRNTSAPGSAYPLTMTSRAQRAPGRILRSKTRKTRNRAAQAFRLAARSVIQSDSALGAFYRRLKAPLGPQQALTATAHKIAHIYYAMCKNRQPFAHVDADTYQHQFREREVKYLRRKAAKLGFDLASRTDSI